MVSFLYHAVVATVAFLLTARFIKGFHVKSSLVAFKVAVLYGLLSWVTFYALGFFIPVLGGNPLSSVISFLICAALLKITSRLVTGFRIDGLWALGLGTIVVFIVQLALNAIVGVALQYIGTYSAPVRGNRALGDPARLIHSLKSAVTAPSTEERFVEHFRYLAASGRIPSHGRLGLHCSVLTDRCRSNSSNPLSPHR